MAKAQADAVDTSPGSDAWNYMAVYLLVLRILKAGSDGAKAVVDAVKNLESVLAAKSGPAAMADAICYLVKSLSLIADEFLNQAAAHFKSHAQITHAELGNLVESAEKDFMGIFGGGAGGTIGGGQILTGLRNWLPTIVSILKLFGVGVPALPAWSGLPALRAD